MSCSMKVDTLGTRHCKHCKPDLGILWPTLNFYPSCRVIGVIEWRAKSAANLADICRLFQQCCLCVQLATSGQWWTDMNRYEQMTRFPDVSGCFRMFWGALCNFLVKVLQSCPDGISKRSKRNSRASACFHRFSLWPYGKPTSHVAIAMEPCQAQLRGLEVQDTLKQALKVDFQTREPISTETFDGWASQTPLKRRNMRVASATRAGQRLGHIRDLNEIQTAGYHRISKTTERIRALLL